MHECAERRHARFPTDMVPKVVQRDSSTGIISHVPDRYAARCRVKAYSACPPLRRPRICPVQTSKRKATQFERSAQTTLSGASLRRDYVPRAFEVEGQRFHGEGSRAHRCPCASAPLASRAHPSARARAGAERPTSPEAPRESVPSTCGTRDRERAIRIGSASTDDRPLPAAVAAAPASGSGFSGASRGVLSRTSRSKSSARVTAVACARAEQVSPRPSSTRWLSPFGPLRMMAVKVSAV